MERDKGNRIFSFIQERIEKFQERRRFEDECRKSVQRAIDLANLERFPDFPHALDCINISGIRVSSYCFGDGSWGIMDCFQSASCLDCKNQLTVD